MEIKLRIRTPKGQASKAEGKIRMWVIGLPRKGVTHDTYVSPEDNEIVWHISGDVRNVMRIQKNAARFDWIMGSVMGNKKVKSLISKECEPGQEEELEDMLLNQTRVEIIKEATAQEMVEGNETWWEWVKNKFKKQEKEVESCQEEDQESIQEDQESIQSEIQKKK